MSSSRTIFPNKNKFAYCGYSGSHNRAFWRADFGLGDYVDAGRCEVKIVLSYQCDTAARSAARMQKVWRVCITREGDAGARGQYLLPA